MAIHTYDRQASASEMAVEIDRRGAAIERLEAERDTLSAALAAERTARIEAEERAAVSTWTTTATAPTDTGAGTLPERLNRLIPLHGYGEPHRPRETLIEAIQRIADLERRLAEAAVIDEERAHFTKRALAAERERDAALASLAEMKAMIADSVAVHVNMLRGAIAKPSVENIRHLYPEIAASLAEKERRIGELEEALSAVRVAVDKGRMVPKPGCGVGGMTIDANLRGSNYMGISVWEIEQALTVLDGPPLSTTGRGSDG